MPRHFLEFHRMRNVSERNCRESQITYGMFNNSVLIAQFMR